MTLVVQSCRYGEHAPAIRLVRQAVFIDEQHVPPAIEFDGRDERCLHVLAFWKGQPIGTGRIDLDAGGKIGRVAVLAEHRRRGVGRAIMAELEQLARQAGLTCVCLHAQESAIAFYRQLGYEPLGPTFIEADIPHCKMTHTLAPDHQP